MSTVTSADGTTIAYTRAGSGPPLILVDGALCYRAFGPMAKLSEALASDFTVYTYDRRGRGESGDTAPYAIQREVEDLDALIAEAGGSVAVYAVSSGAALALEVANRPGAGITRLGLYEAPFIVDDTHAPRPDDLTDRVDELVAADRRSDTVKLFMKTVGAPSIAIAMMRLTPVWKKLKAVAHTIPNDFRILGDSGAGKPLPTDRWNAVTMPTIVMDGGKSPTYMRNSMRQLADVLPNATYLTIPGQTHMVKAPAQAPVIKEFFTDRQDSDSRA